MQFREANFKDAAQTSSLSGPDPRNPRPPGQNVGGRGKKIFRIGSDRLYKIWRSSEDDSALVSEEQPLSIVEDMPAHASVVAQDFYVRLGRLEAGMLMLRKILEKNTHMLQEALFMDSTADPASFLDVDDIVDELLEVQSEPKEQSQWKNRCFFGRWLESALVLS